MKNVNEKKVCDCIVETSKAIAEKVKNNNSNVKGYKILEGGYSHMSLFPSNKLYTPFIIKSQRTKADGETSKPKSDSISIFFTYCPFCGKKL